MLSVAVGWHIYEATGNPFDLALVGLVQILPIAGLFILSGWVVDNLQRKYVLAACAALQALVLVGLALTLDGDSFDRFLVFGLLFISGVGRAFNSPAMQSVLPNIVSDDELPQAVAITNTAWTGADTAGPFIAGLLIAWINTGIYTILATFCVVAGVLLLWLPGDHSSQANGSHAVATAGWRALRVPQSAGAAVDIAGPGAHPRQQCHCVVAGLCHRCPERRPGSAGTDARHAGAGRHLGRRAANTTASHASHRHAAVRVAGNILGFGRRTRALEHVMAEPCRAVCVWRIRYGQRQRTHHRYSLATPMNSGAG